MDEKTMPLWEHLGEFRMRLIKAALGLLVGMGLSLLFSEQIMAWLREPLLKVLPSGSSLVVLAPQEYFMTELKAALFCGLILACPWIVYQLWCFLAPGLYEHEKSMLFWCVLGASFCFLLGIFFAYYLVLPPAFQFFIDTLPPHVTGAYSIGMLYGFAMTILLGFAMVFQTPLIVFLLVMFNIVSLASLTRHRRIVFVACFVVGAILTPPDPLTQVMLALPMYALYELSLWLTALAKRRVNGPLGIKP
jgi:sec-independent protein translocase protein TatC